MPGDLILLYIHVYHKWRSYDIGFLKYKGQQTEIFVILGHFLPFQPHENLENQNFKIEKSTWRYYHFTHLYHVWQSYDVWFLKYGLRQTEFLIILDHLFPLYPSMKKWKKHLKIISFYKCILEMTVIWCMVPETWSVLDRTLSLRTIFCTFTPPPPNNPKNLHFEKLKTAWRYYHFSHLYHKWQSYDVLFLTYTARQTECFVILDCFLSFYLP